MEDHRVDSPEDEARHVQEETDADLYPDEPRFDRVNESESPAGSASGDSHSGTDAEVYPDEPRFDRVNEPESPASGDSHPGTDADLYPDRPRFDRVNEPESPASGDSHPGTDADLYPDEPRFDRVNEPESISVDTGEVTEAERKSEAERNLSAGLDRSHEEPAN